MNDYITILESGYAEYEDRKSVFYGFAFPVKTEAEALSHVARLKKEYPDARHHVYAYVLSENSITRFTDDREPQGTAGMPVLDAIRKNGCTDTLIVVIRYFGGVLLGTGGLVHAYSSAAVSALKDGKIVRFSPYRFYKILASYSDYQKILPSLSEYNFRISDTVFLENVEIFASISSEGYEAAIDKITEISSARVKIEFIEEKMSY